MALAHPNAPTVQLRTLTARGRENLLPQRIVNDAVLELILMPDGDRDREDWETVYEIRRTVERVDDPLELVRALLPAWPPAGH